MFHPKGPSFFELAEQALSSTDHGYDLIAPKFEYTPFRTPDKFLKAAMDEIGEPGSVGRGLDVCCGTGAALRALRPLCRDEVVGIDRSQGMLDEARRLADAQEGELCPATFIQGDATEMSFDVPFDVAVSFGAFGHILPEDQEPFLRAIYGALRPGGRFVFITAPTPPKTSRFYWIARGFNAAMHVRNALLNPPFIMFYLLFPLEVAQPMLERVGFDVELRRSVVKHPSFDLRVVIATRPEG